MKKPQLKEIISKRTICLGCREIIYNPDMAGVAKVGITKINAMLECWKSGIMGDRVILPIFKFSIPNLPCPMRYLFLGKEATLWQSLS
jgi:hypothetical protein